MAQFRYEELHHSQFEELVILICQRLFGTGTQGFSTGADGGRDAKFHGVADLFPSKTDPWKGITIIQAKHTAGYNTSFSESSFFRAQNKSCIIVEETKKIKKLFQSKKLDNYILFSNRKLTGGADDVICDYIHKEVGIPLDKIKLIGLDNIEMYLTQFPDIVDKIDFKIGSMPININPSDLAELIEHMATKLPSIINNITDSPVKRTNYVNKNKINNMSNGYAKLLERKFLKETDHIDKYLKHPANDSFKNLYLQIIDDFQRKIIAKRNQFNNFDEVFNYIIDMILDRSAYIKQQENQKLMKALLFYMYFNCDLGESDVAHSN